MSINSYVLPVVERADWLNSQVQGHWTYANYLALPQDGNRYEVLEGIIYMSPAPNFAHQDATGGFYSYLRTYVKLTGLGQVIIAPFDVDLGAGYVVQPDVLVVLKANKYKLEPGKLVGAPDLVVEVASPATAGYDRTKKQEAYARAGVPEYWIADAAARTVELLTLEQTTNTYRSLGVFFGKAILPSQIVPQLPVEVAQFFS